MDKFFRRIRNHRLIIGILLIGFLLRLFIAQSDPYLHPWDERFHALVARNMMDHPFKPMLRANPVTDNYDPNLWCCNHIWLHKQPVFMWQMAVSMELFGTTLLALRLPSVLMGSLMLLLVYRIGLLFYKRHRKTMACLAAVLLCFSYFHLQLISGRKGMDHNDVTLGFYVLASCWAFAEYHRKAKWYWIILIGLFAGLAVLNKWLLGLFVFAVWGATIVFFAKGHHRIRNLKHLSLALLTCCLVFIPWQLYILNTFPEQAGYEYAFNRRHITEALEGHTGNWSYYISSLPQLFGEYIFGILGVAVLFLIFRGKSFLRYFNQQIDRKLAIAFGLAIGFVFCFFSFVVKTKMDTYLFFIVPFVLLFLIPAVNFLKVVFKRRWILVLIYPILFFFSLNPFQLIKHVSPSNTERNRKMHNTMVYKQLKLPDSIQVVMNLPPFEDVELMFFQNSLTAYSEVLSENDLKIVTDKGLRAAVFPAPTGQELPDYLGNYTNIYLLKDSLAW